MKLQSILTAGIISTALLTAGTTQANETKIEIKENQTNEELSEVLIPVINPNTGKIELLTCHNYPICDDVYIENKTKDKKDEK